MTNTFRNQYLNTCHPETHEIIINAESAYRDGEITLEQKWDVIKAAIAAETEMKLLGNAQENG